MTSSLHVHDYQLMIHLGCTAGERQQPQEVRVSLHMGLPVLPRACETDQLEDTICYDELCGAMTRHVQGHEFHTIEFLTHSLHRLLRDLLPPNLRLRLRLHKVHPPIEGLLGGTAFELGDA